MLYLILHSMDECVTCRKALRGLWTFSLQKSRDLPHACWWYHPQSKLKVAAGVCGQAAEELSRERKQEVFAGGGGGRMSCHLRINADIMMSCPQLCSHHAALGLVWCFHVESSNCFLFFFQQICVEGLSTVCQAMRMQQRAKQRPYPHPTQLLGRETEKK